MPLSKIKFAPGVNKEGTEYSADAGWFDADKIRFRQGRPEKIGGWEKFSETSFLGVCRSIHDWSSLESIRYIGLGTHLKFYVVSGDLFNDVTPIRLTSGAGDATFAATNGSSTITVTENSHGAVVNDFVTFSDAASLGGNVIAAVLNQEYQIASVPTTNTFTIVAKDTSGATVTANASDTGNGGSSTVAAYQINTGTNAFATGTGWGTSGWGVTAFGSVSSISSAGQLRLFSQDNFGEDLVFNPRGGGIYYWDESSGTGARGVNVSTLAGASNVPEIALQVMVSDIDQHVIAFGSNPIGSSQIDPLFIRFSDQENAADWTPTATNTAGGVRINSGSQIIGAVQGRQEILVFTDVSLHSMRFVGAPFTFQFQTVSTDISMISPNAAVNARGSVYFMDKGGFYVYNGSVQPLPCSVKEYVFSNINEDQFFKVFAAENNAFSEVIWYYPIGSGDTEITNYVSYNYAENLWSVGTLVRGAWRGAGTRNKPLATSVITDTDNNYLYSHEVGFDDDGSPMTAYVESGDLEIEEGQRFMMISRVIPDFAFSGTTSDASIDMTIKGKDFPLGSTSTLAAVTVTSSTDQNHVRARARHPIVRLESSGSGYGWRLGDLRFDIRSDGRR
mgnify:FL=1|tara:strand:+ start:1752 stop:3605 length:1854 start_codon:yes stop_codon:yes gene_type:complete